MTLLREHLVIVPVVMPLVTGALMLLIAERRYALKGALAVVSTSLMVAVAVALMHVVDSSSTSVYRLGDWPAPFGIVLVADRLSALMVLLTSILGLCALLFALARWHRAGPRFHPLMQFLLMGVNGAFLTGDLFNLFVFFEVLLAASYGLALHGSGTERIRTSLHYIAVNLTASLLFLVGASLFYGVTGTLNMADLAARIANLNESDRALAQAAAAVLGIAFLIKAAAWPLGFWLPGIYGAAAAPVAALFAILTKVGVYAVLRVWLLFFGDGGSPDFGRDWLLLGGTMTIIFGCIGALASQNIPRLASFTLIISAGTLLAAISVADVAVTAAALYYLVASTLGVSALFLLIELTERGRGPAADILAVTADAFGIDAEAEAVEEVVGRAIPGTLALLGLSFACCALVLASLPPLPGFIAKFALFAALLEPTPIPLRAWLLIALMTVSGIALIIALGRTGVRTFWASPERSIPRVRVVEIAPVLMLLLLCFAFTAGAGPAMRYMHDTALALHSPAQYLQDVLAPP